MSLTLEKTPVLRGSRKGPYRTRDGTLAPQAGKLGQVAAERMRLRRKQLGLTLLEVAKRVGTTPQTIQRLETANMLLTVDWVERIAAVLETHPFELFADGASQKLLDRAFVAQAETAALKAKLHSFLRMMEEACHEQTKP